MICTEYDQWLKNQDKTVWMIEGRNLPYYGSTAPIFNYTIYQDDGRPGVEEPKAWARLKEFYKKNSYQYQEIIRFGLGFRDHIEWLPVQYPKGIYFSLGAAGDMLWQHTTNYYVLGVVECDKVHKYWYRIPEVQLEQETWDPLPDEGDPRLIWNL